MLIGKAYRTLFERVLDGPGGQQLVVFGQLALTLSRNALACGLEGQNHSQIRPSC